MLVFILLISFYLFCVFCVAKGFLKNIEFVLLASFTLLLMFTPINPQWRIYFFINFFTNFFTNFSLAFTYYQQCAFIFICLHSFSSAFTYFYSYEPIFISQNLFLPVCTYSHLSESFKTFSCFLQCSWKSSRVYEYHRLKQIFYHQKMIATFNWLPIFQFYVFYFEFFSFCVLLFFVE